jgi:hypothetical protein
MQMTDVTARLTNHGTVMLATTDGVGRRTHVELPIELAEKLKAQIEAALVTARAHYGTEPPPPESHTWQEVDELPGDERGWRRTNQRISTSFLSLAGGGLHFTANQKLVKSDLRLTWIRALVLGSDRQKQGDRPWTDARSLKERRWSLSVFSAIARWRKPLA